MSVDHNMLCINNIISTATTKNKKQLYKKIHSQSLQANPNGNLKPCSSNPQKGREKKEIKNREQEMKIKMVDLSPNISIIILKVSGLNTRIKSQRLVELITKHDPIICSRRNSF